MLVPRSNLAQSETVHRHSHCRKPGRTAAIEFATSSARPPYKIRFFSQGACSASRSRNCVFQSPQGAHRYLRVSASRHSEKASNT